MRSFISPRFGHALQPLPPQSPIQTNQASLKPADPTLPTETNVRGAAHGSDGSGVRRRRRHCGLRPPSERSWTGSPAASPNPTDVSRRLDASEESQTRQPIRWVSGQLPIMVLPTMPMPLFFHESGCASTPAAAMATTNTVQPARTQLELLYISFWELSNKPFLLRGLRLCF